MITSNWRTNGRVLRVSWNPTPASPELSKTFSAPWAGGDENVVVWIHDVASEERETVQEAILAEVMPELASWLTSAASAPEGWRILRHELEWSWADGAIAVTKVQDGRGRHLGD